MNLDSSISAETPRQLDEVEEEIELIIAARGGLSDTEKEYYKSIGYDAD
jgi:hypothetical protein